MSNKSDQRNANAQRNADAERNANAQPNGSPVNGSPVKDPNDWTTGDEPMTAAQASYLHTLATEAGEDVPEGLTKAQASEKIDELQAKTGRGQGSAK